jgi:Transposase, Mutator family
MCPATAALRLVGSLPRIDERRVTAMAETKRMTAEEVVGYLLEGEGLDFLRESLSWVVQQLMEAEVSGLVGAARGERAPEERLTHRNGYRSRVGGLDPCPDAGAPVGRAAADVLDVDPDVLAALGEGLRQPKLGELLVLAGVGEEDVRTIGDGTLLWCAADAT